MKKITLLGFIVLMTITGCSKKISFPVLSKQIYNRNGGKNDKSTFKLSRIKYEARKKAYSDVHSSFLRTKIDTLFVFEGYNIETGIFYGAMWNKENSFNYSYFKGKLSRQEKPYFSGYQLSLVSKWDTLQIRKEEKINGNYFGNNLMLNAFRCYIKDGQWLIDEIYFKDFFDPHRDK